MATSWPQKKRLLGKKHPRLDGPAKSTGQAKYSADINRPGMLHAAILRCPHAHARIRSIDTNAAEKRPGFAALHLIAKAGEELFFAGAEILAIAADTEEHCRDCLHAVKIEYDVLPHQVKVEDALKNDAKTCPPIGPRGERENVRPAIESKTEKITEGWKEAEVTHEGYYGMPVISHQCLEPHGLVAEWSGDQTSLTVWASTQATWGTAQALARHFRIPAANVNCITHYMGGGYGSKFGPDVQGIAAAELAKAAKRPVKLMLDRAEEILAAGNRPSAYGKVRIGATKAGKITAYAAETWGTPGVATSRTVGPLPYVYLFENSITHTVVRINAGAQRAMRAPGHPQSCFLTDCAIDDLAAKLDMDPMQVRLKNLPPDDVQAQQNDPLGWPAMRGRVYKEQIEKIAEACGWKKKWHKPGEGKGVIRHGIGMALHTWGGQASPQRNECNVTISRDGSVVASTSTQDLGTGQRTVTALVVAEILGLQPDDITLKFGESILGQSSGSGGSTTCPSQAPAALIAATAVKEDFLTKIAPRLKAEKADLELEDGKVVDKKNNKSWPWKQACSTLGMDQATGSGFWNFAESNKPENKGVSKTGVGGVQVAEVLVDTETGVVRCTDFWAIQDCGMLINKLACESQVAGGVIMGLNYALFEENILDRQTGRQVNPDMEFYKLGGIKDMPRIHVLMMDMPERGVIGIGEPPTISTHAAVGNAIFNAIGARVPETPFTPDRVLAALAKKGGK